MATLTNATNRAIANYGVDKCREAFRRHDALGEGANTVGFYLGLTTRQADAAINAGRELAAVRAKFPNQIKVFPVGVMMDSGAICVYQVDAVTQEMAEALVARAGNSVLRNPEPFNKWPRP